jgi:hypothetical protein
MKKEKKYEQFIFNIYVALCVPYDMPWSNKLFKKRG